MGRPIDDWNHLNVCSMSSRTIRNVVLDKFVHSVVSKLLLHFLIVFFNYSATGLLVNKVSYYINLAAAVRFSDHDFLLECKISRFCDVFC